MSELRDWIEQVLEHPLLQFFTDRGCLPAPEELANSGAVHASAIEAPRLAGSHRVAPCGRDAATPPNVSDLASAVGDQENTRTRASHRRQP